MFTYDFAWEGAPVFTTRNCASLSAAPEASTQCPAPIPSQRDGRHLPLHGRRPIQRLPPGSEHNKMADKQQRRPVALRCQRTAWAMHHGPPSQYRPWCGPFPTSGSKLQRTVGSSSRAHPQACRCHTTRSARTPRGLSSPSARHSGPSPFLPACASRLECSIVAGRLLQLIVPAPFLVCALPSHKVSDTVRPLSTGGALRLSLRRCSFRACHAAAERAAAPGPASQAPCNDPFLRGLCCTNVTAPGGGAPVPFCANWTGARLQSAGCILYGAHALRLRVGQQCDLQPMQLQFVAIGVGEHIVCGAPDAACGVGLGGYVTLLRRVPMSGSPCAPQPSFGAGPQGS